MGQSLGNIQTKTGDQPGAEGKGVKIVVHGTKEEASKEITLEIPFKKEFKRGAVDTFDISADQVGTLTNESEVSHITIWKTDVSSDWLLDGVQIFCQHTQKTYVFPVFRWIRKDLKYNIVVLDTTLPMDEKFPEQRQAELQEKQKTYEIVKQDGFVRVKDLPADEDFSNNIKFGLLLNEGKNKLFQAYVEKLENWKQWESFEDITSLYNQVFPKPKAVDYWNEDVHFGSQRLQGLNFNSISLVKEIPKSFPVSDDLLQSLLDDQTIEEAIFNQKLFIVDLEVLKDNKTKEGFKLCAPICLLYLNKDDQLLPVAIQLYQEPGDNNPIFTPNDDPNLWTLVKMWFNHADAAYHEALVHLGCTHLLMEGVYLATHRQLSPSHPIYKLLAPHFLYLLAINTLAVTSLVSPGGGIDDCMSYGGAGMMELVTKYLGNRKMYKLTSFPDDIKNRDVGTDVIKDYPYRDDAQLVYDAIKTYVNNYVELYYTSKELLKNDTEVQNWYKELKEMGYQELPGEGELSSTDNLVELLTNSIFTCSATHAAANFNQYEEMGFPANFALQLRGNPPVDRSVKSERDHLDALPTMHNLFNGMALTDLLSEKATKSLGDFEINYIYDPKAQAVHQNFTKALECINNEIKERNQKRKEPYTVLIPKNIPNAISI